MGAMEPEQFAIWTDERYLHLNLDGGDSLCLIWIANGAGCKDVGVNYGINKEWITNYYIYSIYMMLDYKYI